jgi:hypothetical protein
MRTIIALALAAATLGTAAMPADAAGCIKGAAVGGAAGHFVGRGHAVLGAAAGCAYGHHRAAKAARAQRAQAQHR